MKEVWINHKQVDFGNAKIQQKVQPGCGIIEDTFEDDLQVIHSVSKNKLQIF